MIRISGRMVAGASALAMAVGLGGCGSPAGESSTAEVNVKGVVKLNGKPATEGEVSFDPSNQARQVPAKVAPIGKDGTYSVTTFPGPNTIRLIGSVAKKYPILSRSRKNMAIERGDSTVDLDFETK